MRILVVSGATGGHIFPALAFLDSLRQQDQNIETLLILPKRNILGKEITRDYKIRYISMSPIKFSFSFKNIKGAFNFLKASLKSIFILIEFCPDTVVGFGSLSSLPIVLFAWIFRIKTMIHEQNVFPGRANTFLAPFVDRIAISFGETERFLKQYRRKIVVTGNPLRSSLKIIEKTKALEFFQFSQSKFTILVMGGSLGSSKINQSFQGALFNMWNKNNLQVIHLGGAKDYGYLKDSYKNLGVDVRIFDFLDSMQYAYSASDLVIARAGALTIAEIIFFKLPAILIPYPYAHKHQAVNADMLGRMKSALIIPDDKLDTEALKDAIEEFMRNPDKLKNMRLQYNKSPSKDAGALLVELAASLN